MRSEDREKMMDWLQRLAAHGELGAEVTRNEILSLEATLKRVRVSLSDIHSKYSAVLICDDDDQDRAEIALHNAIAESAKFLGRADEPSF